MKQLNYDALVSGMQDQSWTLGYDAVAIYNRAKVNRLLELQYIDRYSKEAYIKGINHTFPVTGDGAEQLQLRNVVLGPPLISFESTQWEAPTATVTFNFQSGEYGYVFAGSSGISGQVVNTTKLVAGLNKKLTMTVDLTKGIGQLDSEGVVTFDIGKGFDCSCDIDVKDQEKIAAYFRDFFLTQMTAEDRRYVVGSLKLDNFNMLSPRAFEIRTLKTPTAHVKEAGDYGEGCVMLFITCRGYTGQEQAMPSLNQSRLKVLEDLPAWPHDYPIPNDQTAGQYDYSCALIVSRHALFNWYVKDAVEREVGHYLSLAELPAADDKPLKLVAKAGDIQLPTVNFNCYIDNPVFQVRLLFEMYNESWRFSEVDSANEIEPLAVYSSEGGIVVEWKSKLTLPCWMRFKHSSGDLVYNQYDYHPNILMGVDLSVTYGMKMSYGYNQYENPELVIEFPMFSRSVRSTVNYVEVRSAVADLEGRVNADSWPENSEELLRAMPDVLYNGVVDSFSFVRSIELPRLDVLPIADLLFPSQHIMQLTQGAAPGDLYLVGKMDPKFTSTIISPSLPIVQKGRDVALEVQYPVSRVGEVLTTWAVEAIDGAECGTISGSGQRVTYSAPAAITGSAIYNRIVATTMADNETFIAKALLTVVADGVYVSPNLATYQDGNFKAIELKAHSLLDKQVTWSKNAGSPGALIPGANNTCTYEIAAPTQAEGAFATYITADDTVDQVTSLILQMGGTQALSIDPFYTFGVPPGGRRTLKVDKKYTALNWSVVYGEGTVEAQTGEGSVPGTAQFKAPKVVTQPYAVVKVTNGTPGDIDYLEGFSIISLDAEAPPAGEWSSVQEFGFQVKEVVTLANGAQQAKVKIQLMPMGDDDKVKRLTESEKRSVCLWTKVGHSALTKLSKDEVISGENWGFSHAPNDFRPYNEVPGASAVLAPSPVGDRDEVFDGTTIYVQCGDAQASDLIVVASITPDGGVPIFTDASNAESTIYELNLKAVAPPLLGGNVMEITVNDGNKERVRVIPSNAKPDDMPPVLGDDEVMESLDYYTCELYWGGNLIPIKHVTFADKFSMLTWESDHLEEKYHSLVGYGLYGDNGPGGNARHHIEPMILRMLNDLQGSDGQSTLPMKEFPDLLTENALTFTLQRRKGLQYDTAMKKAYDKTIVALLTDHFGTTHAVQVAFDGGRDRLKIG